MIQVNEIRALEDMARKKTPIQQLHPAVKIIVTMAYIIAIASGDNHEVNKLLAMSAYPVFLFIIGEVPFRLVMKRVLIASPFILGVGILNPFLNTNPYTDVLGVTITVGWMTFMTLILKGCLTITAALLLLGTTGIDRIAAGLKSMKVPGMLILQLLLTYRYVNVLVEEVTKIRNAYMLRAPGQKGIKLSVWGSLAGQLLLRTVDRGEKIHKAMILRGFNGEYTFRGELALARRDVVYAIVWCGVFIAIGVIA